MNLVELLNTEETWKLALDYICRDLDYSQYTKEVNPLLQVTYHEFWFIGELFNKDLAMNIGSDNISLKDNEIVEPVGFVDAEGTPHLSVNITGGMLYRYPVPIKDHKIAEIINSLRDVAIKYSGTQQLRAQIANIIVPIFKGEK